MEDYGCGVVFCALALIIALLFAEVGIIMWLWNLLVVPLFGAPALTYWTAFGLKILVNLLVPTSSNFNSSKRK